MAVVTGGNTVIGPGFIDLFNLPRDPYPKPTIMGEVMRYLKGQGIDNVRLYRADGSVNSRKPHPLELFCGSGQVAVFGWHQKAGAPYQWLDQSPLAPQQETIK